MCDKLTKLWIKLGARIETDHMFRHCVVNGISPADLGAVSGLVVAISTIHLCASKSVWSCTNKSHGTATL